MARPVSPLCFLVTSLAAAVLAVAQTTDTSPPSTGARDSGAVLIVGQSISAMGGSVTAAQISSVVATGTIQPVKGSQYPASTFTWKDTATEFRHEWQDVSGIRVFLSGHGFPASIEDGKIGQVSGHMALSCEAFHVPSWLLVRKLNDPSFAVLSVGSTSVAGLAANRIHLHRGTTSVETKLASQDWYFDASSGLPLRAEFWLPDNADADEGEMGAVEFGDFREVAGIKVPFKQIAYRRGVPLAVAVISTISFNVPIDSSEFDLPAGGVQ